MKKVFTFLLILGFLIFLTGCKKEDFFTADGFTKEGIGEVYDLFKDLDCREVDGRRLFLRNIEESKSEALIEGIVNAFRKSNYTFYKHDEDNDTYTLFTNDDEILGRVNDLYHMLYVYYDMGDGKIRTLHYYYFNYNNSSEEYRKELDFGIRIDKRPKIK